MNANIGENYNLKNIDIPYKKITCIICTSKCEKSTLLKIINRLVVDYEKVKVNGKMIIDCEIFMGRKFWQLTQLRQGLRIADHLIFILAKC